MSEEETRRILGPVAAALDYAHSQGVVHRDIKPGNVIVRKDGAPFVLDFGIAREIQETLTRVTGKLSSGTLLYMSPEQLNGEDPAPAQDVYSFAAMAYECLTGRAPFVRGDLTDQIKHKTPALLPAGLRIAPSVMMGLSKTPDERPKTCEGVLLTGGAQFTANANTRRMGGGRNEEHPALGEGRDSEEDADLVAVRRQLADLESEKAERDRKKKVAKELAAAKARIAALEAERTRPERIARMVCRLLWLLAAVVLVAGIIGSSLVADNNGDSHPSARFLLFMSLTVLPGALWEGGAVLWCKLGRRQMGGAWTVVACLLVISMFWLDVEAGALAVGATIGTMVEVVWAKRGWKGRGRRIFVVIVVVAWGLTSWACSWYELRFFGNPLSLPKTLLTEMVLITLALAVWSWRGEHEKIEKQYRRNVVFVLTGMALLLGMWWGAGNP